MRARAWSEPLVLKLIERNKGTTPEEIIEAHVRTLLQDGEQASLPIDVALIASLAGVKRRRAQLPFSGRIYAEDSGQLVMDLNADEARPRQRFTAAHELIHLAFPGFRREARYRADATSGEHSTNREEEYLCDYGAAALLMPAELVRSTYNPRDGLASVVKLAADAEVSLEAAGNRLASLATNPLVFLVLGLSHKPADTPALRRGESVAEKLRLRYATSADPDVFLPRYKAAEENSVLCRAWAQRGVVTGVESLPGDHRDQRFRVEAKAFGGDSARRVLALAWPED
jgi:hypothetical protein